MHSPTSLRSCPCLISPRSRSPPLFIPFVRKDIIPMGARQKINQSFVLGCVVLAAVIGAACGSWIVFGIAGALLLASSCYAGDIRLNQGPPGSRGSNGSRSPHFRSRGPRK